MDKYNIEAYARFKRVEKFALQFVYDAGYDDYRVTMSQGHGDYTYDVSIDAHFGSRATRKPPLEHLVVRVHFAGPYHKTLRAEFVTKSAESAAT